MKKIVTLFSLLVLVAAYTYAQSPIIFNTIAAARAPLTGTPTDSGKIVQVSGVVYGSNLYHYQGGQTFWLNDGTAGIKIYTTHTYADYNTTVAEGDSVTVVGYLSAYRGAPEIDLSDTASADTIIYLQHVTADTAIVILTAAVGNQTYGTLVQVNNVNMSAATAWGKDTTSTGAHKTYFTAAANGLYIYVDSFAFATNFHNARPSGYFNVRGIGDEDVYNGSYEFNIDPRNWADFVAVTDTTINSINNIQTPMTAIIYPNPASTQLMVTLFNDRAESVTTKLFDVTGKEVLVENNNLIEGANNLQFNTSNLTNGMYILEVRTAEKYLNTKIIVAK